MEVKDEGQIVLIFQRQPGLGLVGVRLGLCFVIEGIVVGFLMS